MLKTVSSVVNAIGALNYKGTWNASTNTPALASGVGTKGDYYVVSNAGSTNLDGITTWYVGDWAAFNGSVWQRLEGGVDDPAPSLKSNSTTGLMQITGPAAGQTRVVTIPDANATMARTDAGQSFTGSQTITGASGSDVLTLVRTNGGVTTERCLVLDSENDVFKNYAGISFKTGGTSRGSIIQEDTGNIYFDVNNDLYLRPTANLICSRVYAVTVGATNRDVYVDDTGVLGYVSSVRASKTNIENLDDVSWLLDLNPVRFNYRKKDKDGKYTDEASGVAEYGLIAEDTEQVQPELCFYDEVDGKQELRGISYSKLITPMLKLIQNQQQMIDDLQTRIAALEQLAK